MTEHRQTPKPRLEPAEPITKFDVSDGGTLGIANYAEAETRADFYEYVAGFWSRSPKDLAEAMDECQPLAWAVHSIYSDFRDELAADVMAAQNAGTSPKNGRAALQSGCW